MSVTVSPGAMSLEGRRRGSTVRVPDGRYMPVATAPDRSVTQRLEALEKANEIRSSRSQLKRDLKAGRVCVLDLIDEPPDYVMTMKLIDVLMAVPKFGSAKANRILFRCRISPSKTLGGMSVRQRDEVTAALIWRLG